MANRRVSRRRFLQASAATLGVPALTFPAGAVAAPPGPSSTTVARYIHARLLQHGCSTLFGVPGATCDPFFAAAKEAGVELVITASDLEAGYAADGYARMRGLGAVSVTAGVGTMSLLAPIAGAFVEHVPIIVVNGGPTPEDLRLQQDDDTLFSHSTGKARSDLTLFGEVTAMSARVESAQQAPQVIDAVIRTALLAKQPGYLEIPKHLWEAPCAAPTTPLDVTRAPSGQEATFVRALLARLTASERPVVLVGIEVQRAGLADVLTQLLDRWRVPWVSTLLSKSTLDEATAGFAGVYQGDRSVEAVRTLVDGADLVIAFGAVLGRQHRKLASQRKDALWWFAHGSARMGKTKGSADLGTVLKALLDIPWTPKPAHLEGRTLKGRSFRERRGALPIATPSKERGLGYDDVLEAVSGSLDERTVVVTDTSLSMYPAAELEVRGRNALVANAVWQSIGFSVAASVGVAVAQERRAIAICGDGGFQMTAQALSTMARRSLRVTTLVLDNGQYGIEQFLLDPKYFLEGGPLKPYLALHRWDYPALAKALGVSRAVTVETRAQLDEALAGAKAAEGPSFIHVVVRPRDLPASLKGAS